MISCLCSFLTFGGNDRKSMKMWVNGRCGIDKGLASPRGACVEHVMCWQVLHCLQ